MNNTTKFAFTVSMLGMLTTGCDHLRKVDTVNKPAALIAVENPVSVLEPIFEAHVDKKSGSSWFGKRGTLSRADVLDLQIAHEDNLVIAASRAGTVTAFVDGSVAWSVMLDEPITSGVAYHHDSRTAVVSTRSGQVVALDADSGAKRWQVGLNATVLTPAIIHTNRILLSANDGVLYGLNLQNGNKVWQFSTQNPAVSVRGAAKPLLLDGKTALFGTADGRIHALNAETGTPLWTRRVGVAIGGSDAKRMSDVDGTPLVVGNRLYVTSVSGSFAGFDMSTGQTMFVNRDFASVHPVAAFGDILVGVDNKGIIYGFNPITGEKLWLNNALTHRKPSNPVVIGEYVAVADYEGVVHLLNLQGNLVGRTNLKNKSRIASLQVQGNRLYAQSVDGQLAIWRF